MSGGERSCRKAKISFGSLAGSISLDHCWFLSSERAEGRILVADLLLRIAGDVPPCLDFVHVLELENDDAVRWGLASYRKGLIEPPSDQGTVAPPRTTMKSRRLIRSLRRR